MTFNSFTNTVYLCNPQEEFDMTDYTNEMNGAQEGGGPAPGVLRVSILKDDFYAAQGEVAQRLRALHDFAGPAVSAPVQEVVDNCIERMGAVTDQAEFEIQEAHDRANFNAGRWAAEVDRNRATRASLAQVCAELDDRISRSKNKQVPDVLADARALLAD